MEALRLLVACFLPGLCLAAVTAPQKVEEVITTRHLLNNALENGLNRRMGFLSEANYNSVHTVLSKNVLPVYFSDTEELYKAVVNGSVIAALISGVPNRSRVTVFSSDLISPRSFQMMPGSDAVQLMEAVDAAVVRTHHYGEVLKAQQASPPFQATQVNSCRADNLDSVPFPDKATATGLLKDILETKKLRILAYGSPDDKPNWQQDGNYKVTPHTGFWPTYMTYFMKHFRDAYGKDIELERVWMLSGGTDLVLNGSIHMTEPYYVYENLHNGKLKKWSHQFSCMVMGYEQQFFSKLPAVKVITDAASEKNLCPAKLVACEEKRRSSELDSRQELNDKLESGPNRKMGFLSEANYNSVAPVLSDKVEPVYYSSSKEIFDDVYSGTILAALISGVPDANNFSVFSSNMISPRAFQMMPGEESRQLLQAVDAAVVRSHNAAEVLKVQQANPPFEAVEVHTCRSDDPSKVPFPDASQATGLLKDVLDNRKLKVLAYGSPDSLPDWGQDGNYQVTPPTGFWPDYMDMWMVHFRAAYGDDIVLERVWMIPGGTAMVLNGSIHMSEPYYIYESLWQDHPKKWSHEFSCVVMGYEQKFFAQKATLDFSYAGSDCEDQLATCEDRQTQVDHASHTQAPFVAVLLVAAAALLN